MAQQITQCEDREEAIAYVEYTSGNVQHAVGLYYDPAPLPTAHSRSRMAETLANALLLSPTPQRNRGNNNNNNNNSNNTGTGSVSGSVSMDANRFMQFVRNMMSSEQANRLQQQQQQQRQQQHRRGDESERRIITKGPLRGLGAADCYRVVGYFLGKAILERQTIPAFLTDYILRHLVGMPVGIDCLRQVNTYGFSFAFSFSFSLSLLLVLGTWGTRR